MSTLVGKKAPNFTAPAVMPDGDIIENFNLYDKIQNSYSVLFFYPLDFTFVCPSELIALNNRINEFIARNTSVIGISVDSHFTHSAWRNTPINQGGIGSISYPLIADITHEITQKYEVAVPNSGIAYRGTFIIDLNGRIRSQIINDLPIGRNIDELIRLVDALQFHEEHGEVCPAGWTKGNPGITTTKKGIAEYLIDNAEKL